MGNPRAARLTIAADYRRPVSTLPLFALLFQQFSNGFSYRVEEFHLRHLPTRHVFGRVVIVGAFLAIAFAVEKLVNLLVGTFNQNLQSESSTESLSENS